MQTPALVIPDEVLNRVADTAKTYARTQQKKWLGRLSDDRAEAILTRESTHNIVLAAARRNLHAEILREAAKDVNLDDPVPEQRRLVLFCDVLGVDKDPLERWFNQRAKMSPGGMLTDVFNAYKDAMTRPMKSEFGFYKERLFAKTPWANGQYEIIRPEASGLDLAVAELSKRLGAHTILSQGGGNFTNEWLESYKDHHVTIIAVTSDPEIHRGRLQEYNAQQTRKGKDTISDHEWEAAIRAFSSKTGFDKAATSKYVDQAVLISADSPEFPDEVGVICKAQNGEITWQDEGAYARFRQYTDQPSLFG